MKKALLLLMVWTLALMGCEEDTKFEASDVVDTSGPAVRTATSWEVWAAKNKWSDTDTAAAKAAGIAWDENSGLTWEQKFDLWVSSAETIPGASGFGQTISIRTPFGNRALPGPTLECAEVAMFMRVAFASWYELPFFLKGFDPQAKRWVFAGHFGFVDKQGNRLEGFPNFQSKYKDYTASWKDGDVWPNDSVLRQRRLGTDDTLEWTTGPNGEELGAGAYFDEIFLNKRAGHFMRLILVFYGSINLADGSNMFHIDAEGVQAGDVLLERWQKKGIGHTIPVLRVTAPIPGKLAIEAVSGSMPRRQPRYDDAMQARRYFTLANTGGVGEASDGTPYAKLGGGIRRWRTAASKSGRWHNEVSAADKGVFIADSDIEAISARPAKFDEILITGSPEEQKAALLVTIESARRHLTEHPASCSARTNRETAFTALYGIAGDLGTTKSEIDSELRVLDDYAFGELTYEASKTCCWNSTTPEMAEIILDFARVEKEQAEAEMMCVEPSVFRSDADGYSKWKAHAESLGRGAEWLEWTEDEPCAQRDVAQDTVAAFGGTSYCAL